MGEMIKEIEEKSNGRVKINYAAGGSILTASKTADGWNRAWRYWPIPYRLHPRALPGDRKFSPSHWVIAPVGRAPKWLRDFFEKYQPEEWDTFHLVALWGGTGRFH